MTRSDLRRLRMPPERWALSAANFISWIYLSLVVLLGVWLLMVMLATGWRPVVITSGSMNPTLSVGDVLLVEAHPDDLLGQRSVITFASPAGDGLITHRVHEVLPETQAYVTKGDANPTVDTDPVSPAQVTGVGRLVVPLLGLPVVWIGEGNLVALAATTILSIAAAAVAVASIVRGRGTDGTIRKRGSEMANRGIRRVRVLAGLMIASQFYLDSGRFEVDGWGPGRTQLLVASIGALLVVNVASAVNSRRGEAPSDRLILAELAGDTVLVVGLTALTGGNGIGWVFIALPMVEAAVRFRLAGALSHWIVLTLLTVGARLWVLEQSGAPLSSAIGELEQLLDQLGVLLLVVIPGAYLTEQLLTDVLRQDRATSQAVERARLLEHVAETGYELNRLGSELFATMTNATVALGFDYADAHLRLPNGGWKLLATSRPDRPEAMPPPGAPGSGLRPGDLDASEVLVDGTDPDLAEVLALSQHDLHVLVRLTVSSEEGRFIVVRAASKTALESHAGSIDALRLLTGQAAVALQNKQLVTELQDVQVELEHQALHDPLTGLPNRAQFLDRLRVGLASATDPQLRHVVLFMDLNGFKGVNDTLGHDAGDTLLIHVAQRLGNAIGDDGMVARLGGDEFTVLLRPVPSPDAAMRIALRAHAALDEPFRLGLETVRVGASIGIAAAELGINESEILRRADAAMYAAKSSKTEPRITAYHPGLDEGERRRGRLGNEFKKALDRDELGLVYQPIIESTSGEIRGVEALLRWTHREMGPVSTATVLELAEVTGRVDDLTAWIFRRALTDIASCRVPEHHEFTVAVNVSPTELASPRLIDTIGHSLEESGLPASRLMVELSERIIARGHGSLGNIERIVELGAGLALDDFGEGRTSLAHLRGLPISQLKLDRLLVQQAVDAEADRIILKSVIGLAHDLRFTVVAEGIETPAHHAAVSDAGADLLQGYGLYRPMELADLQTLLVEQNLVTAVLEAQRGYATTVGVS